MRQFSKHHLLLQIIKDQIQQIEAAIISQQTQTSLKRLQDVLKRWRRLTTKSDVLTTSGRGRLIFVALKTSDSRHLKDVWFATSWRRQIHDVLETSVYVVLKTFCLRRLENVSFTTSWRRLIYDVLKMSDIRPIEDFWCAMSWGRLFYNVLKMSNLRRLENVCRTTPVLQRRSDVYTMSKKMIFSYLVLSETFRKF